jgi:hypothetical protein
MELSNARSQKKLIGPCVICGAEGVEVKFRRFTEDAYHKATQHGTLASTWVLNVSQFCHTHYMIYIVHGTDKGSETSENAVPSKRRWIQGEAVTEQVDRDDSQQELIMETSEVSDDGRIKEIDFIECVRSMAQIFYTREKKERNVPVYDWRNYNKAPLFFLSDVWYWESINHPILEILKKHLVSFSDYPVENYHSLIRRQTRETDTPDQLSRTARVINCLRHDNVFRDTFVSSTRYPYRKEDLIGLTNRASIFLLELFTDVKNNTGKSKWTKRDRNKFSCHLATLNIDVDQRHLPMAFNSECPPFDPSEKCHLQNSCKMLQSTSDQSISLPCGHIYHQRCLQYLEHKCFHCLNYIKNEINYNVKSIISRITDTNTNTGEDVDLSQENEVQSADNDDEVEDLSKQPLFNHQTANQFESALEIFMK